MAWPIGSTLPASPLVQLKCTSFMAPLLLLYSRFESNWWSDCHDKLTSSIHCKARRTWQICERPTWQPLSKCPHHQTQTSYLLYRPCKSNKPSVRTVPYNKVSKRCVTDESARLHLSTRHHIRQCRVQALLKCRTLFLKVFCFQLYSVQYSGHLHLGVFKASSVEIYGGLVGAGTSSLLASSTSTTPHIGTSLFARFPLGTVNRRHPANVHIIPT